MEEEKEKEGEENAEEKYGREDLDAEDNPHPNLPSCILNSGALAPVSLSATFLDYHLYKKKVIELPSAIQQSDNSSTDINDEQSARNSSILQSLQSILTSCISSLFSCISYFGPTMDEDTLENLFWVVLFPARHRIDDKQYDVNRKPLSVEDTQNVFDAPRSIAVLLFYYFGMFFCGLLCLMKVGRKLKCFWKLQKKCCDQSRMCKTTVCEKNVHIMTVHNKNKPDDSTKNLRSAGGNRNKKQFRHLNTLRFVAIVHVLMYHYLDVLLMGSESRFFWAGEEHKTSDSADSDSSSENSSSSNGSSENSHSDISAPYDYSSFFYYYIRNFTTHGYAAVEFFGILSGFVTHYSRLQKKSSKLTKINENKIIFTSSQTHSCSDKYSHFVQNNLLSPLVSLLHLLLRILKKIYRRLNRVLLAANLAGLLVLPIVLSQLWKRNLADEYASIRNLLPPFSSWEQFTSFESFRTQVGDPNVPLAHTTTTTAFLSNTNRFASSADKNSTLSVIQNQPNGQLPSSMTTNQTSINETSTTILTTSTPPPVIPVSDPQYLLVYAFQLQAWYFYDDTYRYTINGPCWTISSLCFCWIFYTICFEVFFVSTFLRETVWRNFLEKKLEKMADGVDRFVLYCCHYGSALYGSCHAGSCLNHLVHLVLEKFESIGGAKYLGGDKKTLHLNFISYMLVVRDTVCPRRSYNKCSSNNEANSEVNVDAKNIQHVTTNGDTAQSASNRVPANDRGANTTNDCNERTKSLDVRSAPFPTKFFLLFLLVLFLGTLPYLYLWVDTNGDAFYHWGMRHDRLYTYPLTFFLHNFLLGVVIACGLYEVHAIEISGEEEEERMRLLEKREKEERKEDQKCCIFSYGFRLRQIFILWDSIFVLRVALSSFYRAIIPFIFICGVISFFPNTYPTTQKIIRSTSRECFRRRRGRCKERRRIFICYFCRRFFIVTIC